LRSAAELGEDSNVRYLALIVLAAVPFLIFGMAFHGARVYSAGEIGPVDVVGFVLQIVIVSLSIFVGVALWKRRNGEKDR